MKKFTVGLITIGLLSLFSWCVGNICCLAFTCNPDLDVGAYVLLGGLASTVVGGTLWVIYLLGELIVEGFEGKR